MPELRNIVIILSLNALQGTWKYRASVPQSFRSCWHSHVFNSCKIFMKLKSSTMSLTLSKISPHQIFLTVRDTQTVIDHYAVNFFPFVYNLNGTTKGMYTLVLKWYHNQTVREKSWVYMCVQTSSCASGWETNHMTRDWPLGDILLRMSVSCYKPWPFHLMDH